MELHADSMPNLNNKKSDKEYQAIKKCHVKKINVFRALTEGIQSFIF